MPVGLKVKMTNSIKLAVNGTLMRGLELNPNLQQVGASFIRETETEPCYRLWSINDRHPAMLKVTQGGRAIAVEVWAIPAGQVSALLLLEPAGLCIGKVRLVDGEEVLGVLGEPFLVAGQQEITQWGGWRAYIADLTPGKSTGTGSAVIGQGSDQTSPLEAWVEQMAQIIDLPLQPAHRPGVVENMARLQAIAQLVMDFPLPEDSEISSVFHP